MIVSPLAGGFTPVHGNLNVLWAAVWIGIVIASVTAWAREDARPRWAEEAWRKFHGPSPRPGRQR